MYFRELCQVNCNISDVGQSIPPNNLYFLFQNSPRETAVTSNTHCCASPTAAAETTHGCPARSETASTSSDPPQLALSRQQQLSPPTLPASPSLPLPAPTMPTRDQTSPASSPPVSPSSPRSPPGPQRELQAILSTLLLNVDLESQPPSANSINVVRSDILGSAFRAFKRAKFHPKFKLDVVFVDTCGQGEGAVDLGGPTREFLTLLMKSLLNSRFFVGPSKSKNLALDAVGMYMRGHHVAHTHTLKKKMHVF